MRFNHMELTFPVGTLTQEFREEVDAFYGSSSAGGASTPRSWARSATS